MEKNEEFKYSDITEKIIGLAMKVHRHFGRGFPESIYHRALLIELANSKLSFESQCEKNIYYGDQLIGKRRLDLLVEQKVLVELKAVSELNEGNKAQIINYLRVFNLEVGLLLNFGTTSLEFKRFVN